MAIIVERPIEDVIEYRPPTQSQNPNMLSGCMPNLATASALVDIATKCRAIELSFLPKASRIQTRAVCAFVIVSSVVKVLEQTIKSVSDGSSPRTDSTKSVPSTFETNRNVSIGSL